MQNDDDETPQTQGMGNGGGEQGDEEDEDRGMNQGGNEGSNGDRREEGDDNTDLDDKAGDADRV